MYFVEESLVSHGSQGLDPDHSCRAAVARLIVWLTLDGRKPCAPETGSYCDARQRLPLGVVTRLVRRANVGAFHLCLWTFTMTEAWAWGRVADTLVDRSVSPWNDPSRRPIHADKRQAWRRALLAEEIRKVLRPGGPRRTSRADRLLSPAA